MAKHPAKCPKCGGRLEYESATDEKIVCPACQVLLSVPGKVKLSDKVDPLLGQSLGQFEILDLLGRGGMGAVYKARQPSLDRLVAVKVLPRAFARDASFVERFTREARDAAAVVHPNIIPIYDVGQDKGFQFIAMEFVEGESLADTLKREGPLAPDRALDLFRQVTAALAKAHAAGVVHRDIKPANILVTPDGHAKVADFGLAKRTGTDVSVTHTGAMMGTPLYFPPEAGRGERYDARSDLYSLGATFYHLLAGKPPFTGAGSIELALKHSQDAVPPLKQAAPAAPAALCGIIHKLLQKKADDRFQSAADLLEAIDRVAQSPAGAGTGTRPYKAGAATEDVGAGPRACPLPGEHAHPSLGERRAAKAHAHKKLILIGGAAALVLVLILVLALRPGPSPQSAIRIPHSATPSSPAPGTQHPAPSSSVPPTPPTQHPTPPRPKATSPAWEIALNEADTKAKPLLADQRYGEAIALYEALGKLFDDQLLKIRVAETLDGLQKQADTACREAQRRSQQLLADRKFDDARAALKPIIERYGVAWKADQAKKALEEIDAAEKAVAAKPAEPKEAPKEDEAARKKAEEQEKQRQAEAARRDALAQAEAAYAEQSEKVWALFRERNYAEADKLLANLPKVANLREAMDADLEAAKLLKGFWAAVERSLAAKKGRFIAFGGAGGSIAEVKDGQVILRSGRAQATLSIHKLTAKQALAYCELQHDERSSLMKAVVLLADGTALDEAAAALGKAGDQPLVAIYKERVDALKRAAAEAAAQKDWLRIEEEAKGKLDPAEAARLTKSLGEFAKAHGETKFYKGLGEKLAALKTRIEDSLVFTEWPFDEKEAKRRQKTTADARGVKVEQEIEIAKGVKMTFVLIPAGEFLMGSPPTTSPEKLAAAYGGKPEDHESEFPQHRVKISRPFWMAKHEVTQEQWMALFATNPSRFKDKPKNPVEQVDWNQASGFAKELSEKLKKTFRLPTEAEWEYACRAGTATEFYFGNDAAKIPDFGWQGVSPTAPVGLKKPNAWGLFDMAGNVWEWVEDWHGKYEAGAHTDPKGAPAGGRRVLRGGSWFSSPRSLRSACRDALAPGYRDDSHGFRVVLAAGPK